MKTETIRAFQEALKDNPTAEEMIRNTPEPENMEGRCRLYAKIAEQLGFDLTGKDLAEYAEEMQRRRSERTEAEAEKIEQLPEDELDEVAGGGDHPQCKDTFRDQENCWYNDGCDVVYHRYDNYECHYDFQCSNYQNWACGKTYYERCRTGYIT